MFWIILAILAILIAGAFGVSAAATTDARRRNSFFGVVITIVVFVVGTLVMSVQQIGSGEVGIIYNVAGVVDGQLDPGTHTIAPWNSLTTVDIKTQSVTFQNLDAFSKESQDIYGTIQVNYHLDPVAVQNLYRSVGANWYDKYIPGTVNQDFKELTVQYVTTEIAPNRAQIAKNLLIKLKQDLEPHSIYVDSAFVLSITYSKQFTDAIEAKQVASQRVQQAQLEADTVRAQARGQADAAVTIAQGQAKANQLLSSSITDQIIRYQAIQKLNPNVQTIVVPEGSSLLNLSGLTKTTPAK